MSKERVTVWLEEETIEMLDGVVEEAARDPEIGDEVSKSMLARHLINLGVEEWSGGLRELLPDPLLEKYRLKWQKKRRKDADYGNKLAAYWRQNVNRELTKFYDDEAPAPPERVRLSMEGWREEAEELKDGEELQADLAWLDRKLEEYEEAVEYTELVPDRGFERVSPEVETGADLNQLRRDVADLVRDVEALSEGDAIDPDAIRDRLAGDYGVGLDAIEEFLDLLVRDDLDVDRALKGNHEGDRFRDAVDARALGEGSVLSELDGETEEPDREIETEIAELPEGEIAAEDLTSEAAIETAVEVIEAGEDPDRSTELRKVTSTDSEREAAILAAKDRLDGEDSAVDGDGRIEAVAAANGGEAGG